eukprot:6126657-Prymnesium_polylepis.2
MTDCFTRSRTRTAVLRTHPRERAASASGVNCPCAHRVNLHQGHSHPTAARAAADSEDAA